MTTSADTKTPDDGDESSRKSTLASGVDASERDVNVGAEADVGVDVDTSGLKPSDDELDNTDPHHDAAGAGQHLNSLPAGHTLRNWIVEKELGAGGFEITYLVRHKSDSDRIAVIREYLPIGIAVRGIDLDVELVLPTDKAVFDYGKARFLEQAQALARIDHINVVRIIDYFELGNTAYTVMDYVSGRTLQQVIEAEGPLADNALRELMAPLLNGLEAIHTEVLHHAIIPSNILIRDDGFPVLIDIGAARESTRIFDMSDTDGPRLSIVYHSGYVPIEQIDGSENGPWTDIYALGACFYFAAFAEPPVDIAVRSDALQGEDGQPGRDLLVSPLRRGESDFSPDVLTAIEQSLRFSPERRPASIAEWRAHLSYGSADASTATSMAMPTAAQAQQFRDHLEPETSKKGWFLAIGFGVVALLAAALFLLRPVFFDRDPGPASQSTDEATPTGEEQNTQVIVETSELADEQMKADAEAKARAEEQMKADADAAARAEAQMKADAEAAARAEEQLKADAEAVARAEKQAKTDAETATPGDEQLPADTETATLGDEQVPAETEAPASADDKALAEKQALAEQKMQAEEQAQAEQQALAEEQAQAEQKAQAEQQAQAEQKAQADQKALAEAEAETARQARLAEEARLALESRHKEAELKLYEGIEKVEALAGSAAIFDEILQDNPNDDQARRGKRVLNLLRDVRTGVTERDVDRSLDGLERIVPIWTQMNLDTEKLQPLLTLTQILQREETFLNATLRAAVLNPKNEEIARNSLLELKGLGLAQPRLDAGEATIEHLKSIAQAIETSNFDQIDEALNDAEKQLGIFVGSEVKLIAASNQVERERSRYKLQLRDQFADSLEQAHQRLAVRPIDAKMVADAESAFESLLKTHPDHESTKQVLANLGHTKDLLAAFAAQDIDRAEASISKINLLASASSDEERNLLTDLEKRLIDVRVTLHLRQTEEVLADGPLSTQQLQQAQQEIDTAQANDDQRSQVQAAASVVDSLKLLLGNISSGDTETAASILNNAKSSLPAAGFDPQLLDYVDKQIGEAQEQLQKQKQELEVVEKLGPVRAGIEANPDSPSSLKLSHANLDNISKLDPNNVEVGELWILIGLLSDAAQARAEGKFDRALKLYNDTLPIFNDLDMNAERVEQLITEVESQNERSVDIKLIDLFTPVVQTLITTPFDRQALESARSNVDKMKALRPDDPDAVKGQLLLEGLTRSADMVEQGKLAAARTNLDATVSELEAKKFSPDDLNAAYAELEKLELEKAAQ